MTAWPVLTLLAIGTAIATWFRPVPHETPPATPTYSDAQVATARDHVCATYDKVHHAVLVNTGRTGGDDPTAVLARAANARIALFDGGVYLSTQLAEEPATPPDLTKAVRALVTAYQQLAIDYLADADDSDKKASGAAITQAGETVYGMCK